MVPSTPEEVPSLPPINPDLAKLAAEAKVGGRGSPRTSRSKRLSEAEPVLTATPTQGKRISEISEVEQRPATPTRSKRISEMSEAEQRPATPTRSKRISEMSEAEQRPATPTRKSRRLSGSIPEFVDSPAAAAVLPLKKRRLSAVEPAAVPETVPEEEEIPDKTEKIRESEKISESATETETMDSTAATEVAASLDVIMEEEEADKKEEAPETPVEAGGTPKAAPKPTKPPTGAGDAELKQLHSNTDKDAAPITQQQRPAAPKDADAKLLAALPALLNLNKIPRQKPKSGKFWKAERKQFRSLRKDKGLR